MPGQVYDINVTSSQPTAKILSVRDACTIAGKGTTMKLEGGVAQSAATEATCRNKPDKSNVSTFLWTAPESATAGNVEFNALCGAWATAIYSVIPSIRIGQGGREFSGGSIKSANPGGPFNATTGCAPGADTTAPGGQTTVLVGARLDPGFAGNTSDPRSNAGGRNSIRSCDETGWTRVLDGPWDMDLCYQRQAARKNGLGTGHYTFRMAVRSGKLGALGFLGDATLVGNRTLFMYLEAAGADGTVGYARANSHGVLEPQDGDDVPPAADMTAHKSAKWLRTSAASRYGGYDELIAGEWSVEKIDGVAIEELLNGPLVLFKADRQFTQTPNPAAACLDLFEVTKFSTRAIRLGRRLCADLPDPPGGGDAAATDGGRGGSGPSPMAELLGHRGAVTATAGARAPGPGGAFYMASASADDCPTARIWNPADWAAGPTAVLTNIQNVVALAADPSGTFLAVDSCVGRNGCTILILDPADWAAGPVATLDVSGGRGTDGSVNKLITPGRSSLAVDPAGAYLIAIDERRRAWIWDTKDWSTSPVLLKSEDFGRLAVAFDPHGEYAAFAGIKDRSLALFTPGKWVEEPRKLRHDPDHHCGLEFVSSFVAGRSDGAAYLAAVWGRLREGDYEGYICIFYPDEREDHPDDAYVPYAGAGFTYSPSKILAHEGFDARPGEAVIALAAGPSYLAAAHLNGKLRLWNVADAVKWSPEGIGPTVQPLAVFDTHLAVWSSLGAAIALTVGPDGAYVAAGGSLATITLGIEGSATDRQSRDGRIQIWDTTEWAATGDQVQAPKPTTATTAAPTPPPRPPPVVIQLVHAVPECQPDGGNAYVQIDVHSSVPYGAIPTKATAAIEPQLVAVVRAGAGAGEATPSGAQFVRGADITARGVSLAFNDTTGAAPGTVPARASLLYNVGIMGDPSCKTVKKIAAQTDQEIKTNPVTIVIPAPPPPPPPSSSCTAGGMGCLELGLAIAGLITAVGGIVQVSKQRGHGARGEGDKHGGNERGGTTLERAPPAVRHNPAFSGSVA